MLERGVRELCFSGQDTYEIHDIGGISVRVQDSMIKGVRGFD